MTENVHPRPPLRGRPSKQEAQNLRERIQATTLECFLELGYAGSSIEGIARRAGVSRTTIYSLYIDKPTLFTEMIRTSVYVTDLTRRVVFDDREPVVVLREAMIAINRVYAREPNLDILRLCIAEADRFPELIEGVRAILGAALSNLTNYLTRLCDCGVVKLADPYRAALLFNLMALGSLKPFFVHPRRLLPDEMSGHIDMALEIFLHGCLSPPVAPAGTD